MTHSLSGVDGVGRVGCSTLRYLVPRCSSIDVFLGRDHRGFAEDVPRAPNLTIHATLPTNHFPFMPLPKLAWVLLLSLPTLWRAARRADVVHSLSDYPMGLIAVIVARLAGKPVVVSGHGTYSVTPLTMKIHGSLIRWMYAKADRFVMGAAFALKVLRRSIEPRAAEVVRYGVVPEDYDSWRAHGVEPGVPSPYVLCVGEVKQRKGYTTSVPAFLEAWRQRPQLHYAIVGRVAEDDPYHEALVAQITAAGATDHVHFLGNVDEAQKVALMRGCLAFMMTPMTSVEGSFEAFGLVFLEAGAAGRPVVGVFDSGAEDAITEGENGFIRDRDDTEGLGAALVRLVDDDELAAQMGRAGRERALSQTWEHAAIRLIEIYEELIGAQR